MKPNELKKIMQELNLTSVDIASSTKLHPTTVEKFLKGGHVNRSTLFAIEQFVASKTLTQEPAKATG